MSYYFLSFAFAFVFMIIAPTLYYYFRRVLLSKGVSTKSAAPEFFIIICFVFFLTFCIAYLISPIDISEINRFLETSRGFRALIGLISGALGAYLFDCWKSTASNETNDSVSVKGLSKATTALPIAIVFLFLFVLFAPRGEIDLRSVRSLRIASVEAEFDQARSELLFEIESEPQSFFRAQRTGLGEVLHLARSEVFYLEAVGEAEKAEAARLSYDFLMRVLQPVAICAMQIDSLYGDQALLRAAFQSWGGALTRALRIRATLSDTKDATKSIDNGRISTIKEIFLEPLPSEIADARRRQIAALNYMSGSGKEYTANTCMRSRDPEWSLHAAINFYGDPSIGINSFNDEQLERIFQQPMTAHAASLFFLWSGNPRAARTLLRWSMRSGNIPGAAEYPGLAFARGFTERWLNDAPTDVRKYLQHWEDAVKQIEERNNHLRTYNGYATYINDEQASEVEYMALYPVIFPFGRAGWPITNTMQSGLVKEIGHDSNTEKALLSHGYFKYFEMRIRNHIIFEAAREVLADRRIPEAERILELAAGHAQILESFVENDGFNKGSGAIQQKTKIAAARESNIAPVSVIRTDESVERTYVLFLDSIGLFHFARARRGNDDDAIEAAIGWFDRALERLATLSKDEEALRHTIWLHRQRAREALLLPD